MLRAAPNKPEIAADRLGATAPVPAVVRTQRGGAGVQVKAGPIPAGTWRGVRGVILHLDGFMENWNPLKSATPPTPASLML
jgi:hypothetical protein